MNEQTTGDIIVDPTSFNDVNVSNNLGSEAGITDAEPKHTEFDVQKTGEELRGYLKSEADYQEASKKALEDKAAAALKAGVLLTEIAEHHKGHFDEVCRFAGLAKSRVYDLMKAAKGGVEALKAMQEGNRKRQQKHRAQQKLKKTAKAAETRSTHSVTPLVVTEAEAPPTQPAGGFEPDAAAEPPKVEHPAMEQEKNTATLPTAEPTTAHVEPGNSVNGFRAACDRFLPRVDPDARMSCLEYAWEIVERLAAAQNAANAA